MSSPRRWTPPNRTPGAGEPSQGSAEAARGAPAPEGAQADAGAPEGAQAHAEAEGAQALAEDQTRGQTSPGPTADPPLKKTSPAPAAGESSTAAAEEQARDVVLVDKDDDVYEIPRSEFMLQPGWRTREGGDMFAQVRRYLDQLERDFRGRQNALDARDAVLTQREADLDDARAAFQETVQEAQQGHERVAAAQIAKSRQLAELREAADLEIKKRREDLDAHYEKVRAMDQELSRQRGLLEDSAASAAAARTKLQRVLVTALVAKKKSERAVLAAQEESERKLEAYDLRRPKELLAQAQEHGKQLGQRDRDLQSQQQVIDQQYAEMEQKDKANAVLDEATKKLTGQLDEAVKRTAAAREEAAVAATKLATTEEELSQLRKEAAASQQRASELEREVQARGTDRAFWAKRTRAALDKIATGDGGSQAGARGADQGLPQRQAGGPRPVPREPGGAASRAQGGVPRGT